MFEQKVTAKVFRTRHMTRSDGASQCCRCRQTMRTISIAQKNAKRRRKGKKEKEKEEEVMITII